ncbi:hypothetical protein HS088_TW19G00567 [Tripterygium wilfordii]|uniref:Uncharacterized protein n=1 Tax=Tripterygium wilfordii TaxID=458696 RepID=A0A7J7C9W7_TRIWF|nr:hypothetical protein HS088_TW19G00567 [Tripterygium wilfordii]
MPKLLLPSAPMTDSSNANVVTILQLLDKSPETLVSSLQQKRSPSSDRAGKVRNNDWLVEEILRERRVAIDSGRLKGRRLFESLERATVIGLEGLVR